MTTITMKAHETTTEAQGLLEANSEAAWLAVAETMQAVTPAIRGLLFPAGLAGDVEDVAQDALISAVSSAHRWNPARGPLVAWVTQIGKRRAIDHLRRVSRRNEAAVVLTGQSEEDETLPVVDVAEDSFEERLLDRMTAWDLVASVLGQVKIVMRNDETMRRALMVLVECDGDVAEAARRLGMTAAVAREARRQVVRMAIVVHRAQTLHRTLPAAGGVQVEDAMDCLPDADGAWTRTVLTAIRDHGSLIDFRSEDLRTVTGWCLATCRQRLDNVSWLLSVIQEIVLAGEVTFSPPVVPTTEEVAA